MKKIIIGVGVIVISIASLVIWNLCFQSASKSEPHASAAAILGSDKQINLPSGEGAKGTDSNPFIILEIVPYEGYAEIGYTIGGCEPVDMDKLAYNQTYGNIGGSTYTYDTQCTTQFSFDESDSNYGWRSNGQASLYGYFVKVPNGTGSFIVTLSNGKVTSYKKGKGDYNWVMAQNPNDSKSLPVNYQAGQTYIQYFRSETISYVRNYYSSTNYEYFKKNVLGLTDPTQIANYKITVITITPQNLNLDCNFGLIDRSDLIYFSPKSHVGNLPDIWENINKITKTRPTDGFLNNDLTWKTTAEILRKASVADHIAPIIFDPTLFTTDGGNVTPVKKYLKGETVGDNLSASGYLNNVAKLYMVMQQMPPAKFYNEYIQSGLIKAVQVTSGGNNVKNGTVNMTTGYYISQDSNYSSTTVFNKGTSNSTYRAAAIWNRNTFLPYELFAKPNGSLDSSVWKTVGIDNYNLTYGENNVSVRHNLYSYNGDCSITQNFMDGGKVPSNSFTKDAFDYYNMSSGSISPSMAIRFLINNQTSITKTTLRILEVEPSKDFVWDGSAYANQYFKKFFPNFNGTFSVTSMTSSEFIGKIEDLNTTYDLIFFGLRSGGMRTSNGSTIYNDQNNMNGRIYSHNGDTIKMASQRFRGLPGTDNPIDVYRLSGNDITNRKLNELKSFMNAGNPVILDDGFYTSSSKATINTSKIDPNSYMYDLADYGKSSSSKVFYADGLNTNQLASILNQITCKIVFGNSKKAVDLSSCYPVIYKDKTKAGNENLPDSQIYINGNNMDYRTLKYNFYIRDTDDSTATYTLKLYIDVNADGRYDPSKENITNLSIKNEQGQDVDFDSLKPGVNYTVTRNLEMSYTGIVPWKLEITSNSYPDGEVRDSVINYSAIKPNAKTRLNILEIKSSSSDGLDLNNSTIKKYISGLNNFDINIKMVTISSFLADLKATSKSIPYILSDDDDDDGLPSGGIDGFDDDMDGVYDFDMIVVGFADMYNDISDQYILSNIQEFINQGRTVLFTHDTTSYINNPNADSLRGYNINRYFRDFLGMDRFGATKGYSTAQSRKDAHKDYASDRNDYSGYIQGYSNGALDRYAQSGSQYASNKNATAGQDWQIADVVTKTNDGQLTQYPYEIPNSFKPADTHSQYYQLDLDNKNIVVWYCLNNSVADKYYSTAYNDTRNNYYIYNLGNVTYSGMGHSKSISDVEAKLFVNTMIAAYNASAKPISIEITNKNISKDSNNVNYVYVDYDIYNTASAVGKDVQKGNDNAEFQRIKFRVYDNNVLLNKTITMSYYAVNMVNGLPAESRLNNIVAHRASNDAVVSTNSLGDIVNSGTEYYIDIPLSDMQNNKMLSSTNFATKLSLHATLTYGTGEPRTISSKLDFILVRRGLFDLD